MNLGSTADSVEIHAFAPGLDPASLHVDLEYRRTFALSKELDAEHVSAELAHGVLRVRSPKAPHARPRCISEQVA